MAYGTPYKEEDIERYYTHIRRGRKPTEEMLEDLKGRYEAIGGISPLAKITMDQAKGLEAYLNEIHTWYREPTLRQDFNSEKAPKIPRITDGDKYRTVTRDESSEEEKVVAEASDDSSDSSDSSSSSSSSSSSDSDDSSGKI